MNDFDPQDSSAVLHFQLLWYESFCMLKLPASRLCVKDVQIGNVEMIKKRKKKKCEVIVQ